MLLDRRSLKSISIMRHYGTGPKFLALKMGTSDRAMRWVWMPLAGWRVSKRRILRALFAAYCKLAPPTPKNH